MTGICFKQWIICLEKKKSGNGLRIKITKKHSLELGLTATRSMKRRGIWLRLKASGQYIMNNPDENAVFFYSSRAYSKLTRKELEEAGFGWVFDCPGIEIEEAEG